MIKLIALDIDGTLLNTNGEISSITKKAIERKRQMGVEIVICTGRPLDGTKKIIKELGLAAQESYVVSYNGTVIQKLPSEEVVYRNALSFAEFAEIERLSYQLEIPFHIQSDAGVFTTNKNIGKYTLFDCELNGKPLFYREKHDLSQIPINKVMFAEEADVLEEKIAKIPQKFYDNFHLVRSLDVFFEFLSKDAGKGHALSFLSQQLGVNGGIKM